MLKFSDAVWKSCFFIFTFSWCLCLELSDWSIKPESQIYQYLIDKLQCHAKDILFIGDTPLADYSGPTEFGMSARLIDRKSGQKLADVLNDIL